MNMSVSLSTIWFKKVSARPSSSPWASPLVLVPKSDGSWRICGDYRLLNAVTTPDRYPVPHIPDINTKLHGKIVFSKLDLIKAYNQIPMNQSDAEKTAVITPFGLFEYAVMPFGLRNAGATFQRAIDNILRDLDCATPYIDDVLVASTSLKQHYKDRS